MGTAGYVDSDLSARLVRAQDFWVRATSRAVRERIARPEEIRALAFCVDKAHASVVADRLSREGLRAKALTDDTPKEERRQAKADLTSRKVQVLCVVDLFNEGVDIPDINTVFLYRPTESATVFLQQLGRGASSRPRQGHPHGAGPDWAAAPQVPLRPAPQGAAGTHPRASFASSSRRASADCLRAASSSSRSGPQHDILARLKQAIPSNSDALRGLLDSHRDSDWELADFLRETEVDLFDLYRNGRSWASLRASVALIQMPSDEEESSALSNVQKLLHVSDETRLAAWRRLAALDLPTAEFDRRLAAMLFVVLYGRFRADELGGMFERWSRHAVLRDEVRQLVPVLQGRADALPRASGLDRDVPLVVHGRYLDVELSAAFAAIARSNGRYRSFYTGVEPVADGRYDLLLVTLDKGDVKHEHLQYADFPLTETLFQWQSKSDTRADSEQGLRHLTPQERGVTPLLFVRESKKDARGVTNAFRYLGPVRPSTHRGERPITIEWSLSMPLLPEWVRRWRNVA